MQFALNDLVGQNDHISNRNAADTVPAPPQREEKREAKMEEKNDRLPDEEDFELAPHQYHQLDNPLALPQQSGGNGHSSLLAQQNKEY